MTTTETGRRDATNTDSTSTTSTTGIPSKPFPITGHSFEIPISELTRRPTLDDSLATFWPAPDTREVERLRANIDANGLAKAVDIDPNGVVVDPDGEAILTALEALGNERVHVLVTESRSPVSTLMAKLQGEHLNLVRLFAIITAPPMWKAYKRLIKDAKSRQKGGGSVPGKGRSRDLIAAAIGVPAKGRELQSMLTARRIDPDTVNAIARGEVEPSNKVVEDICSRRRAKQRFPWKKITSDLWIAGRNYLEPLATNSGKDFKGGVPEEVVANLIEWCTRPGDLVVDPMGGSGRTWQIATRLDRRCVTADQNEAIVEQWKRAKPGSVGDFHRHFIESGPVPGTEGRAKFVMGEIPYFDIMHRYYGADSSSGLSWDAFRVWLRRMAASLFATLSDDGLAATFCMNVNSRDLTIHRLLRPELEAAMEEAGFILADPNAGPGEATHVRELVVGMGSTKAKYVKRHAEAKAEMADGVPPIVLGKSLYVQIWRKRPNKMVFEPGESFSVNQIPVPKRRGIAVIDRDGRLTILDATPENIRKYIGNTNAPSTPPSDAEATSEPEPVVERKVAAGS
jgi:hypothetical protein